MKNLDDNYDILNKELGIDNEFVRKSEGILNGFGKFGWGTIKGAGFIGKTAYDVVKTDGAVIGNKLGMVSNTTVDKSRNSADNDLNTWKQVPGGIAGFGDISGTANPFDSIMVYAKTFKNEMGNGATAKPNISGVKEAEMPKIDKVEDKVVKTSSTTKVARDAEIAKIKKVAKATEDDKKAAILTKEVDKSNYSAFGKMSVEDGKDYNLFWEQVGSGEPRWGERPNPQMLLSQQEIDAHLSKFENGGSYLITEKTYMKYIRNNIKNPILGRPGELFISSNKEMNNILLKSKGDYSIIEKSLGFNSGTFSSGGGLVRIDIENPFNYDIRMPTGNEYGANPHFLFGGKTDGGVLETVVSDVPNDELYRTITHIKK